MSIKEDLIAALRRGVPETAVPIWELEFHPWNSVSSRRMVLGREFEAATPAGREKHLHANAEIMITVAAQMHWSAVTVPGHYWNQAPGQLAYFCLPDEARFRQIAILRELAPPDLTLVASGGGILSANYSDEFCERMFEDPESIDQMAEQTLTRSLESAKKFRDLGVEAVFSASDIADNNGPFFNPQQMDRWIFPYLKRWSDGIRGTGLFSILHSDGNLTPYIDRIADSGVDALQAIDTIAGMDIAQTQAQVAGRLCLCGNVDCGTLLTGNPVDVFEATKKLLLACKPGGGWVLGASNAVQLEVPADNYRAMIEAWKKFGSYRTQSGWDANSE